MNDIIVTKNVEKMISSKKDGMFNAIGNESMGVMRVVITETFALV